jgi:hypothetical protein
MQKDLLPPLAKEGTNLVFSGKNPALVVVMGECTHEHSLDWLG